MSAVPEKPRGPFGDICEADRKAALNQLGKLLIDARDWTIVQWDQTLLRNGMYPPWQRIKSKYPDIDQRMLDLIRDVLPHIADTFMYCLLANLEHDRRVRVAVDLENKTVDNIATISWALPAEPTGDDGWLVRFAKERFEQPT